MLKQLLFAAFALPLLCAGPAAAQEAPAATAPPATAPPATAPPATAASADATPANEDEDEIVVEGRRDRAMNAFLSRDFVTAEREFANNLRCIERIASQNELAFGQARLAAATGVTIDRPSVATSAPTVSYNNAQNPPPRVPQRTCEAPDWQLYMMGLSQLGQGKRHQAKETLYRVVRTSTNYYLYDAYYRVALLELQDGNIDEADHRLRDLHRIKRFCDARGESCDVREQLNYEVAYLTYAVDAARHGQLRLR